MTCRVAKAEHECGASGRGTGRKAEDDSHWEWWHSWWSVEAVWGSIGWGKMEPVLSVPLIPKQL